MKAAWNGTIVAESDATPRCRRQPLLPRQNRSTGNISWTSQTTTMCPWKGDASYYTLEVGDAKNRGRRLVLTQRQRSRSRDQGLYPRSGVASKSPSRPTARAAAPRRS